MESKGSTELILLGTEPCPHVGWCDENSWNPVSHVDNFHTAVLGYLSTEGCWIKNLSPLKLGSGISFISNTRAILP